MTVNGKIKGTSLFIEGTNGDFVCTYNDVERWRIWREGITTFSYSPRYRAYDNGTTNQVFNGYLTLASLPNCRIIKLVSSNPFILKQNEECVCFFWPYAQGMSSVPPCIYTMVRYSDNSIIYNTNKSGDNNWAIVQNTSGTIVAKYNSSTNVDGIGIFMQCS